MIEKCNFSGNVLLTYIQFLQHGVMAAAARRNGGGGDKIKFDSKSLWNVMQFKEKIIKLKKNTILMKKSGNSQFMDNPSLTDHSVPQNKD